MLLSLISSMKILVRKTKEKLLQIGVSNVAISIRLSATGTNTTKRVVGKVSTPLRLGTTAVFTAL